MATQDEYPSISAIEDEEVLNRLLDQEFWKRFWTQVEPHENEEGETCLKWTGYTRDDEYGRIGLKSFTILVHRARVLDAEGLLRTEEQVHHRCENNWCVRLDHLEIRENLAHQLEHSRWDKDDLQYLFEQFYLENRRFTEVAPEIDMNPSYASKINAGEVWQDLDLDLDFDPDDLNSYAGEHNSKAELIEEDIPNILHRRYIDGEYLSSIAEDYPVSRPQIGNICRRESWPHVPIPAYIRPHMPDKHLNRD